MSDKLTAAGRDTLAAAQTLSTTLCGQCGHYHVNNVQINLRSVKGKGRGVTNGDQIKPLA